MLFPPDSFTTRSSRPFTRLQLLRLNHHTKSTQRACLLKSFMQFGHDSFVHSHLYTPNASRSLLYGLHSVKSTGYDVPEEVPCPWHHTTGNLRVAFLWHCPGMWLARMRLDLLTHSRLSSARNQLSRSLLLPKFSLQATTSPRPHAS